MELDLGMVVHASDGEVGTIADLVVDPVAGRLTHVVVEPHHRHRRARLVPVDAIDAAVVGGVTLTWTKQQVESAPLVVQEDFVVIDPDHPSLRHTLDRTVSSAGWPYFIGDSWTSGVPSYTYGAGRGRASGDDHVVTTRIERLPAGTVEIRRRSEVVSSDGHVVGHVDGFIVAPGGGITHLVLARGHRWTGREVTIPIGQIAGATSDRVDLSCTRDEVGGLPTVPFQRRHRDRQHAGTGSE